MVTGPRPVPVRDRDREIVRLTAELLSSGVSLSELFERFCLLLAQFVDASVVFIAIATPEGAFIEYAYDHGVSRRDAHQLVNPRSQTQRVLDTGQSFLMRTTDDIAGPLIPLRMQGAERDDSVSAVFVPLRFGSQTIGVLSVQSPRAFAYDDDDKHLLETCALYVAVAVHADEIRSQREVFESAATIDSLTGVANRWAFDQHLASEWRHARRDGAPLSLVLLDIDWFKPFNDTYGHVAGDACLEQVAVAARSAMSRETDLFARYGGEEFAAILSATDADGAIAVAERMREAVAALEIPHLGSPIGTVTASFGVATCIAATESSDLLVRTADRALYAAKSAGRNRAIGESMSTPAAQEPRRIARNNLRPAVTSFLGRRTELQDVMLVLDTHELVTITGAGGVGKTRLALAVAQHRLYAYLDGAWLIDFASIRNAAFVDGLLSSTLSINEPAGVTARQALLDDLRTKNRLLIFDNCEHLREPIARLVDEILAEAPQTKILATSREPLKASGEVILHLKPLERDDAAALFVERARAAFPAFSLDATNAKEVATLCDHLDNLPLAIELAAPRIKTMTPGEIVGHLNERFRVLVGTRRDTNSRQQTLYAMIDWSFSLLDLRAQRLLTSLAIFPASFDADAVRDICSDKVVEPWDVVDVLDELVDKNLLVAQSSEGRERFRMLESTREYASMQLVRRADSKDLMRRHIGYFRAFAQRAGEQIERGQVELTLAHIETEWENIAIALSRALLDGIDPEAGRLIVRAISRYWSESGHLRDGRYWIEQALAMQPPSDARERAELLYAAALIAHSQGDFIELGALGEQLIAAHFATGDTGGMAKALNALGNAKFHLGEGAEAERLYRDALEKYRAVDDRRGVAVALMNLGSLAADNRLDFKAARALFQESLELFQDLGTSINIGTVLANLGEISAHEGDYAQALIDANESMSVFERLGNGQLAAWQLINIAHYRLELNEFWLCADALQSAYEKLQVSPHPEYIANYCDIAWELISRLGNDDTAAMVIGFVERYRADEHVPRQPSWAYLHIARRKELEAKLPAEQFETLRLSGAAWTLTQAHEQIESVAGAEACLPK